MIHQRKGKYKHKVTFKDISHRSLPEINEWCEQHFGPGGRNKKYRWRYGWTDKVDSYYFKSAEDATLFMLRWA